MSDEIVKVAVLEQKFADFVGIVNKLDDAIQKLSEVNTNLIKMLAVHDEKIEQCNKTDNIIISMIEDIKESSKAQHEAISKELGDRIERVEEKVESLTKFRWMAAGVIAFTLIFMPVITNFVSNSLQVRVEQVKNK
jgi:hypothetical protein